MNGLPLTDKAELEVLTAYAAPEQPVLAVEETPGWFVVGAFHMPLKAQVRLELIGSVSEEGLTMRARLFCITEGALGPIAASVFSLDDTITARALSATFELVGGRDYQMQVEVTGAVGVERFGSVMSLMTINGAAV